jgi:hypothetical protein
MLAVFGIGMMELLILGAIFLTVVIGVVVAVIVVVAAAGRPRRD